MDRFGEKLRRLRQCRSPVLKGTRSHGLRRSRYVGLAKTHLPHLQHLPHLTGRSGDERGAYAPVGWRER